MTELILKDSILQPVPLNCESRRDQKPNKVRETWLKGGKQGLLFREKGGWVSFNKRINVKSWF